MTDLSPIPLDDAILIHYEMMWHRYPEEPVGVRDLGLLDSALARPGHEAVYGQSDAAKQAATLLWGLVMNHPFKQGNKRTATVLTWTALARAGYTVAASLQDIVNLVSGIDNEGRGRSTMWRRGSGIASPRDRKRMAGETFELSPDGRKSIAFFRTLEMG